MTGGGIVMCMAAAKNTSGLIAARFFLGVPDSGVGTSTTREEDVCDHRLTKHSPSNCILLFLLVRWFKSLNLFSESRPMNRYLPKERAFRLGVLFSANAIGVASSGLLAIAIDNVCVTSGFPCDVLR